MKRITSNVHAARVFASGGALIRPLPVCHILRTPCARKIAHRKAARLACPRAPRAMLEVEAQHLLHLGFGLQTRDHAHSVTRLGQSHTVLVGPVRGIATVDPLSPCNFMAADLPSRKGPPPEPYVPPVAEEPFPYLAGGVGGRGRRWHRVCCPLLSPQQQQQLPHHPYNPNPRQSLSPV